MKNLSKTISLRVVINPLLEPGTLWLVDRDAPTARVIADSVNTVERVIKLMNEHEKKFIEFFDEDFLRACGILSKHHAIKK